MPEGDTIRFLATRINVALQGQRCVRCITRDNRLDGVDLTGSVLQAADAYGKHLFVTFDSGAVLHGHLLMTGAFAVSQPRRGPAWRRRIELTMERGSLDGIDVPLLGMIKAAGVSEITTRLGPDLCGSAVPDADAITVRLCRDGSVPLAGALLNQANCAGFGNVYAIELPFLVGLSPWTRVGDIADLRPLVETGIGLIRFNATNGLHNTTGKRIGTDDRYIYGRARRPCPICGTRLSASSDQHTPWNRQTVWCPTCQPTTGSVDLDRVKRLTGLHPGRPRST
jgi:endonuclease VIII